MDVPLSGGCTVAMAVSGAGMASIVGSQSHDGGIVCFGDPVIPNWILQYWFEVIDSVCLMS